jgi:predicted anti-sigma-YlaC factor YlaD
MTDLHDLDELLRATDGDVGCAAAAKILDAYVQLEIRQEDPAGSYPGTAIHLQSCPACRADYEGLLGAARRFGDIRPE